MLNFIGEIDEVNSSRINTIIVKNGVTNESISSNPKIGMVSQIEEEVVRNSIDY